MTTGIYAIRNTVTGKIYIGSSFNVGQRFRQHLHLLRRGQHHSVLLQRAWQKYGEPAFTFELLESTTADNLMICEQRWIDETHATNPEYGYNILPYALSSRGRVIGIETRRHMSEAAKRRKGTPETRAKISKANKGKKRSVDARARMSAAQRLRAPSLDPSMLVERARRGAMAMWANPEARILASKRRIGSKHTAETREKMSAARKGSRNACAKLTEQDVQAIRQSLANGDCTKASLARQYGVSSMSIRRIELGTHWRHVS